MSNQSAISVKNVSKGFKLPHEKHSSLKSAFINMFKKNNFEQQKVLKDISFEIKEGEFFGIIGRNGSGKSTLLKLLAEIYTPTNGSVSVRGKLTPFIELGVGFNQELSGRENVYLNGALLGFNRKEVAEMYDDIVEFAGLKRFMDQKLKNYSSGMQVRLAFSIAIRAKSDILLLDEVLAVGDYEFQQKCFEYFKHLKSIKKTVVFVSHDMNNVKQFCTSGLHLENGNIVEFGDIQKVINSYNKENIRRALENEKSGKDTNSQKVTGNGLADITRVHTSNKGKIKKAFAPEEQINVTFSVKANEDIKSPVAGMIFTDAGNQVVFATNTLDQKKTLPDVKKGQKFTVEYAIPNIYADGNYTISGAVASSDRSTIYCRIESAATFKSVGWDKTAKAMFYPEHKIKTKTD